MPQEYALGNPTVYVRAVAASQALYSPDGRFVPDAIETAYQVLKVPAVAAVKVDLGKTHTFAYKALRGH
jgi:hypothetical protein